MAQKLFLEERLDQIGALLQEQGRASVTDLSERFGVSAVTIRNDLGTLEQQGRLVRTHGGAMALPDPGTELPAFALRKELHLAQKEKIGQAAAALVRDGDSIALDASTTAWQIARHLKDRRELTIVTNGLFVALEFLDSPSVTVVMPGGSLRAASASLVGDQGAGILDRYHVQKGFFGAGGFTIEEGLTDTNQYEVELKRHMVQRSKQVVAVIDSSKWGQVTFASLAAVDELDHVISDLAAPPELVNNLRELGIRVTLVPKDRSQMTAEEIARLESELNSFDPAARAAALDTLASRARQEVIPPCTGTGAVNMHCHSFFSFNAFGHSPSSLAWIGKQRGFALMGIVDFDVLDGVDEFLNACELSGLGGSAGIETRVFVPEYASQEINSPGEPGVCYHMGVGFSSGRVPDDVAPILADLGRRAAERNQRILSRVNAYLAPVIIDYKRDVLPLTPAGHPTERHLVAAYIRAALRSTADPAAFWAGKLDTSPEEMATIMADAPRFQNLIRARLMKRGGVGYVQPQSGMFPSLEDFHELIVACGALPCAAWLDGTTATEKASEEWLDFLIGKGVVALNIIPDRNWNVADPEIKRIKVQNLYRVVELAREMDLPLNIGTEMNSFGQKLVDDLATAELAPVRKAFVDGAHFVYGHTALQRALGLGYQSEWARAHLPARRQRNDFYTRLGYRIPPGPEGISQLRRFSPDMSPDEILSQGD